MTKTFFKYLLNGVLLQIRGDIKLYKFAYLIDCVNFDKQLTVCILSDACFSGTQQSHGLALFDHFNESEKR